MNKIEKKIVLGYPYYSENIIKVNSCSLNSQTHEKEEIYILTIGLGMLVLLVSMNVSSALAVSVSTLELTKSPTLPVSSYVDSSSMFLGFNKRKLIFTLFSYILSKEIGGVLLLPPSTSTGIGYWIGWLCSWIVHLKPNN